MTGAGGDQMAQKNIPIKISDEIAAGAYANNLVVSHSREEFTMDFMFISPTQGTVNARIVTTPGHMKRVIRALMDNVAKYESKFGPIIEHPAPENAPAGDLN